MSENVLYIKQPFFSSTKRIAKRLSEVLDAENVISPDKNCIILKNANMIVTIRKHMITVVLLDEYDVKRKRMLYDLVQQCL